MLFLLNDVILSVTPQVLTPPLSAKRFAALDFEAVRELGQELYAEFPMLQRTHAGRAERLATLLLAKSGRINAALFVSPRLKCAPDEVAVRFAEVDFAIMAALADRQSCGRLTAIDTDRQVWRRLAA